MKDDWLIAKQTSTMGQELASSYPAYQDYMGADVEIAKSIAILNVLVKMKYLKESDVSLVKALLIEQNRATFASSEKTDNLTKLGLGVAKQEMPPADGSL